MDGVSWVRKSDAAFDISVLAIYLTAKSSLSPCICANITGEMTCSAKLHCGLHTRD